MEIKEDMLKEHHAKVIDGIRTLAQMMKEENKTVVEMLKDILHDDERIEKHAERIEAFEEKIKTFIEKYV